MIKKRRIHWNGYFDGSNDPRASRDVMNEADCPSGSPSMSFFCPEKDECSEFRGSKNDDEWIDGRVRCHCHQHVPGEHWNTRDCLTRSSTSPWAPLNGIRIVVMISIPGRIAIGVIRNWEYEIKRFFKWLSPATCATKLFSALLCFSSVVFDKLFWNFKSVLYIRKTRTETVAKAWRHPPMARMKKTSREGFIE